MIYSNFLPIKLYFSNGSLELAQKKAVPPPPCICPVCTVSGLTFGENQIPCELQFVLNMNL